MSRGALLLLSALALAACGGPEDTLTPFDITLITASDCSQVGQGGINCELAEELAQVSRQGRWFFDYRGADTFVLTTADGKSVAGVYFPDTGEVPTRACVGEGGTCHFARTRFTSFDAATSCTQLTERVIDVRTQDGVLEGEMSNLSFTEDTCGTSLITEVIVNVSGTQADEAVLAREGP